jgi:hypothetical protein
MLFKLCVVGNPAGRCWHSDENKNKNFITCITGETRHKMTVVTVLDDLGAQLESIGTGSVWDGRRHSGLRAIAMPPWRKLVDPINFADIASEGNYTMLQHSKQFVLQALSDRRAKQQPEILAAAQYLNPLLEQSARVHMELDQIVGVIRDFPAPPGRGNAEAAVREVGLLQTAGGLPGHGDHLCVWNSFEDDPLLFWNTLLNSKHVIEQAQEWKNIAEFAVRLFSMAVTSAGTERAWKTAKRVTETGGPQLSDGALESRTICMHMLANLEPDLNLWECSIGGNVPTMRGVELLWTDIDADGDDVEGGGCDPDLVDGI